MKLKKYKFPIFIAVMWCVIFPSLVFSYTNITITDINARQSELDGFVIEWNTNLNTKGRVDYGENNINLSQSIFENGSANTKHLVKIKGLEEGKKYYFQIDASNAVTISRSNIFEYKLDYHFNTSDVKENEAVTEKEFNFDSNQKTIYYPKQEIATAEPYIPTEGKDYVDVDKPLARGFSMDGDIVVAGIEHERYPGIQAVYKTNDSPKIWLIANNQRHLITSPTAFESYGFSWGDIKVVTWPQIVQYKLGKLVKGPDSSIVYFLQEKKDGTLAKIVIPSSYVFDSYSNNKREDIVTVSQFDIDSYENVALLQNISDGYIYYVSGNVKHYIARNILEKYNYSDDDILKVNTVHLSRYEAGDGLK